MAAIESLEIVELTKISEPETIGWDRLPDILDDAARQRIQALTRMVIAQEIPAYQVDAGDTIAGTLAVRNVIEAEMNSSFGQVLEEKGLPPWRMTQETGLIQAYARREHYAIVRTLPPHKDKGFHGLAMHRNYMSPQPVRVQFGFSDATISDHPSFHIPVHYDGTDGVEKYTDTVWEGETVSGRLTVFSEGNTYQDGEDLFNMQPAVHMFDRRDMPWAGIYTRYACVDLRRTDWTDVPYDDFTDMRLHTSHHLEYARWHAAVKEIESVREALPDADYENMHHRASHQLKASEPYAPYKFWNMYNGVEGELLGTLSYGVYSEAHTPTSVINPYILNFPKQ